jgi:putative transposase
VEALEQLMETHSKRRTLRVGNELTSSAFTEWCGVQGIELRFIEPGKPDQNAYIERFKRTCRDEVLAAYVFDSIEQVGELTEAWLPEYNEGGTARRHPAVAKPGEAPR